MSWSKYILIRCDALRCAASIEVPSESRHVGQGRRLIRREGWSFDAMQGYDWCPEHTRLGL